MHDVVSLMRTSKEALAEMFDRFTVAEWIEQKLYPMYRYLTTITINIIYIKTITIITILNIINTSSCTAASQNCARLLTDSVE